MVTGKTAEKQDKCSLELSREHIPAFTPYTLHFTPYSTGRLGGRRVRGSGGSSACPRSLT